MRRTTLRFVLVTALFLVFAASAAAQGFYFTVTLKNGNSFDTRYRPLKADFDPSYSLFRTDMGNWIAIANDDISDVTSREQESGFGYRLDTSTVFVGWSPNDLVETDEETGEVKQKYDAEAPDNSDYSIDKFLNVPQGNPGSFGGGIPYTTGGGGGDDGDG